MQEFSQINSTVMEPGFSVRPAPRGEVFVPRPREPEGSIIVPYLIYFVSLFTIITWRIRETSVIETDDFIDTNAMVNIITLFACYILFVLLIRWTRLQYELLFRGPMLWFSIFVSAALISVLWSPYFQLSIYRWSELFLACILMLSIISKINSRERVINLIGMLCVGGAMYWFIQRVVFINKLDAFSADRIELLFILCKSNFGGAASACTVVIGVAILMAPKGNRKLLQSLIYIIIGIAGLIFFRSAASFFATQCAVMVLLVFRKRIFFLGIGGAIILSSILFIHPSRMQVQRTVLVGKDPKHIRTWTGRRSMWRVARTMIKENPIFGYGFGAAERQALAKRTQEVMGRSWSNSHNGFIGALLGAGIMGAGPLVFSFVACFYFLFKAFVVMRKDDPREYRVFYDVLIGVLCVLTVNNLSIPGIGAARAHFMNPVFIIICLAITKHQMGELK